MPTQRYTSGNSRLFTIYENAMADHETLMQAAIEAAQFAYIPYSNYRVGAALLGANGVIYRGCNVENASYPAGICAERTALVKAVSEGCTQFTQLVVVTANGGSPCGVCRQMLFEFAPDLDVIMADFDGNIHARNRLSELLLHGFGPAHLV